MYPPLNRPAIYNDRYCHSESTALLRQTLSQILRRGVNPDLRPQRLQADQESGHTTRTPHPGSQAQAGYSQEYQNEARVYAEVKHRYEEQIYRYQLQKRQALEKRRTELRNDPSALFRHYNEYMTHFPAPRCERPNLYHMGLLANQEMPEDRQSERAVAIAYAKAHWENAWEDKRDYQFVVELIRDEEEKREKARREAKNWAYV